MRVQQNTLALISCAAFLASPLAASPRDSVRTNRFGAPVVDSDGRRVSYHRGELMAQAARATPERTEATTAVAPVRAATTAALTVVPVWSYAGFGEGIGKSNIRLSGDLGTTEIYVGASTSTFGADDYWYALRYDAASDDYRQVHVSPRYAAGVERIEVADAVGDPAREIVVALVDGRVLFHDPLSKLPVGEMTTAAVGLQGMKVRDVDGDGASEVVVCTTSRLYVYAADGTLEWDLPVGGSDLIVGQLDGDAALEIAVTDGSVVDVGSRQLQWQWGAGFGRSLAVGDIDDDGMEELIAAEAWYTIWSYDVDRQLPKWSIPTGQDIGAIHLGDVDGDSVVELLVGEGQWGDILAFDTVTLGLEWSIRNPEHGVTAVATGDANGDGGTEVLWGAGATSTGSDRLYVADVASRLIEWENLQLDGPFLGPRMGDLDGDGVAEIVAASWEADAGYDSGRIIVFDSRGDLRAVSDGFAGDLALTGTHDLELIDIDADGRLEILVAVDRLYDGVIEIYDFGQDDVFTLNWTNATRPSGAPFYSVAAADVDGDGQMEIVGGGGREHTGAAGTFIYVYDYATGTEEWTSLQMGPYWGEVPGLALADLDEDGSLEIAGMVASGDTYIFDGVTKQLESILPGEYTFMESFSMRSLPYLLLGDANGDVSVVDHVSGSYQEIYRENYAPGELDGVHLGWNAATVWTASAGRLTLDTPTLYWESDDYGDGFGRDILFVPGRPILASGGGYGLTAFAGTQ